MRGTLSSDAPHIRHLIEDKMDKRSDRNPAEPGSPQGALPIPRDIRTSTEFQPPIGSKYRNQSFYQTCLISVIWKIIESVWGFVLTYFEG
jgi:hypothetical protein